MKQFWRLSMLPLLALAFASAACRSGSENEPISPVAQPTPAAKPVEPAPVRTPEVAASTAREVGPNTKAELGQPAPNFALKDLDGKTHTLAQYKGKTVVLEWFSPACPTCQRAYSKGPLDKMPERYQQDGIVWLSVNSEAATNKAASPEANRKFVDTYKLQAPLLFDPTGVVGRSYGAKTTPHMYVIDPKGTLIYKGALDNAPSGKPEDGAAVENYVDAAVADMRAGRPVKVPETRSYG